jgi:2-dehydro-3-deoxyphosphogluconate aldolase/(4S)-4-hydroxy-2-oxoglutarate aldolase
MMAGQRIVPVLAFNSVEEALDVCSVLVNSGISLLEITLRTSAALDCIAAVSRAFPTASVGVGTVLSVSQLRAAQQAGAVFGVSPGLVPELLNYLCESRFPFLPGVATLSEAMVVHNAGLRTAKLFPAEQSGGAAFIKAAGSVLPDLRFCPTGGVNPGNARDYLQLTNVAAIGGSWMIKRDLNGSIDLAATAQAVEASFELLVD